MPQPSSSSIDTPGEEAGGEILPAVARNAIIEHLSGKPSKTPPPPATGYLAAKAGVYVTLRDKNGEVRGVGGQIEPTQANLIEETRHSACLAAFEDDQFKPVKDRRELNKLTIEVSVLSAPERVDSIIELDPEIYGVALTSAKRGVRGVMLPDIAELSTVDKQLAAIRRKAGLFPDERLRIERFRVERFVETTA